MEKSVCDGEGKITHVESITHPSGDSFTPSLSGDTPSDFGVWEYYIYIRQDTD